MGLKGEWMGHPMRLELTLAGLLVKLANHYITRDVISCKITPVRKKIEWQHLTMHEPKQTY